MKFSRTELIHLTISALTITAAFYILFSRGPIEVSLPIIFFTVGLGFIFHELGHKSVAQRFGCVAEYRLWMLGLFFALAFAIFTPFVFAAPGAVYIHKEYLTIRENGLISLSGPMVNVLLGLVFLWVFLSTGFTFLGLWGFRVNFFLALFNMIPFPPLDGSKVVEWNPFIWGAVFFPLVYLTFFFI